MTSWEPSPDDQGQTGQMVCLRILMVHFTKSGNMTETARHQLYLVRTTDRYCGTVGTGAQHSLGFPSSKHHRTRLDCLCSISTHTVQVGGGIRIHHSAIITQPHDMGDLHHRLLKAGQKGLGV